MTAPGAIGLCVKNPRHKNEIQSHDKNNIRFILQGVQRRMVLVVIFSCF